MKVLMVSKSSVLAAHHGKLDELAKMGVDLTVIVPPRWGSQRLEIREADRYTIRALPCWFTPRNHFHFYPARIGPIDADVVYLEEEPWSLVTQQFVRLCVRARKPVIFTTWQNIHKNYPPPFDFFERYTFRHAHAAVAGNREVAEVLRARGFTKLISVVPHGVDPEVFIKRDATPLRKKLGVEHAFVVGFVGRVVASKGIADLVRAFALLPSDSVLVMVGDGDFWVEGQRLAASLGVNSRVRWIREVPSLEVPNYINLLDALVLPSRTMSNWKEQFGRVLVEAMACQVPPVGSSSGEIPHVIGDAGLVFPEGDADALAEQLRCLYQSAELRGRLGRKGRTRVLENYTHKRMAEQNLSLYQEVLANCFLTEREQVAVLKS
jgi:glycosyltransferase involved in cell wall biosynthesis